MLSTFGMFNTISGDEGLFDACETCPKSKLKVGGEATYTTPLPWLGFSARYDLVQPNMKDSTTSFSVLSPRILLRTEFVSHEQIIVMYSRYFNKSGTVLSYPFDEMKVPADENVFSIIATMWW